MLGGVKWAGLSISGQQYHNYFWSVLNRNFNTITEEVNPTLFLNILTKQSIKCFIGQLKQEVQLADKEQHKVIKTGTYEGGTNKLTQYSTTMS